MGKYILRLELSRKGVVAWEDGWSKEGTGRAIIICGENGESLKPVILRDGEKKLEKDRSGKWENFQDGHAAFLATPGIHFVIHDYDESGGYEITEVIRLESIRSIIIESQMEYVGYGPCLFLCMDGRWTPSHPPEKFSRAIEEAIRKARCVGCNEAHYYSIGKKNPRGNGFATGTMSFTEKEVSMHTN